MEGLLDETTDGISVETFVGFSVGQLEGFDQDFAEGSVDKTTDGLSDDASVGASVGSETGSKIFVMTLIWTGSEIGGGDGFDDGALVDVLGEGPREEISVGNPDETFVG